MPCSSRFRVGSLLIALWIPLCGGASNAALRPTKDGVTIKTFTKGFPRPLAYIDGIAVGQDGALWFTEHVNREFYGTGYVGRMTTDGQLSLFTTGLPYKQFTNAITSGPDGAMWFTIESSKASDAIGRITPDGTITEFPLSGHPAPGDIVTGPDGALWFPEIGANKIGRLTTAGQLTEYSQGISPGSYLSGIAVGSDGALWFTEFSGSRIGRITTGGVVTEYSKGIPSNEYPQTIAAGPDGALWFTQVAGYPAPLMIGRITTTGVITEFSKGITATEYPGGITAGPGSAMWFTEYDSGILARITMDGRVTEYPAVGGPGPIVGHLGGTLWFGFDEGYGHVGIARATL
jgi:virginiamycin B lyase